MVFYKNRKNNQAELIHNEKEQFMELKTEDQCVLLTEIKKLFVCSPMQADLTLIGGSKTHRNDCYVKQCYKSRFCRHCGRSFRT